VVLFGGLKVKVTGSMSAYCIAVQLLKCCCSLTYLESLELRDNVIRCLPPSAAALVNLRFLDVGGNLLDQVVSC